METRDGDHLQKPRKESAGGSREIADEPAKARPEPVSYTHLRAHETS